MISDYPAGRKAAALFALSELTVETLADFHTAARDKRLSNVTADWLTALAGRRAGMLREPAIAQLAPDLRHETAAAARAERAHRCDDAPNRMLEQLQATLLIASTPTSHDRRAGGPAEHDGLLGSVIRGGMRLAIANPASCTILTLPSGPPTAAPERS